MVSKSYEKGGRMNLNKYVYKVLYNGTSYTISSAFLLVSGSTFADNNVTWKDFGPM